MKRNVFLKEGNVGLSALCNDDVGFFYDWLNKPRIVNPMGDFDLLPFSSNDAKDYVSKHFKDTFMICVLENDIWKPIGYTGVFVRKRHSVGIWRIAIGEDEYLNKGFAKQAGILMLGYMFKNLNLKKVHISVSSSNIKACSLYEKIGFKKCGKYLESRHENGKYYDEFLMEYHSKNYFKNKKDENKN